MRISDWSSDVCSSDLACRAAVRLRAARARGGARCGARRVGEAAVIVRAIGVLVLAWTLGFAVFMVALPAPLDPTRTTDAIVVPTGGAGRIDRGIALIERHAARRMQIGRASCRERVCQYV